MKKAIQIYIVLMMVIFPIFSFSQGNQPPASTDYTVLQPLPGIGPTTNLSTYLPSAFNLSIGIAVALAFVMIVFGGIMYATSDAISNKSAGKEYIENALWGLLLVIGAYTILYTINPQILTFDLTIQRPSINEGAPVVITQTPRGTYTGGILDGYTLTPAEVTENDRLRDLLMGQNGNPGIGVNHGPCTTGGTQGCTNLVGLPPLVISNLIALKSVCDGMVKSGCVLTVTGGAEGGHATHGPGRAAVDISDESSIRTYFATLNPRARTPVDGTRVNLPGGGTATYEVTGGNASGTSTGDHWHIQY